MAKLITCIYCKKQLSSDLYSCIHCGNDPRGVTCSFCGGVAKKEDLVTSKRSLIGYFHDSCLNKVEEDFYSGILHLKCSLCNHVNDINTSDIGSYDEPGYRIRNDLSYYKTRKSFRCKNCGHNNTDNSNLPEVCIMCCNFIKPGMGIFLKSEYGVDYALHKYCHDSSKSYLKEHIGYSEEVRRLRLEETRQSQSPSEYISESFKNIFFNLYGFTTLFFAGVYFIKSPGFGRFIEALILWMVSLFVMFFLLSMLSDYIGYLRVDKNKLNGKGTFFCDFYNRQR
jgi:hypothetical protein